MNYLDTNIFVYAIENHPKYGKKCAEILQKVQTEKIKVCSSLYTLIELINVLHKINKILQKEGKNLLNVEENIIAILSLPILWYDLNLLLITHFSKYTFSVSSTDYIHISTMELNSVFEIISADEDFDKISFLKRIDPLSF